MLKGPRVTLRAVKRDDLPLIWQFNNDLEVELAGGGDPPMPQALDRAIADYDRAVASGGRDGAVFAIEVAARFIGICQLSNFNETAHTCELGIAIGDKTHWGKGYGREAVALLLEYAFRYRNFRRVWLWVHADNERGLRSYESCGFIAEGRLRQHVYSNGHYVDAIYMGILREEWESAHP